MTRNNTRIYLPDSLYKERTHAQVVAAAAEAERTKSCVLDVYGSSPLAHSLDLVASVPIDYIHAVLEGVTRWLMKAWFDSKFHSSPFYIGLHVREVDCEFLKQRTPSEFSRWTSASSCQTSMVTDFYGDASCTANAHFLTHLGKYVRLWGPL